MKQFLTCLAAVAALFTVQASDVTGTVTASKLKLRLAPSLKSPAVGHAVSGAELTITGVKDGWLEIKAPKEVKLYVSEALVPENKTVAEINVRSAMAGNAPVVCKLPAGTAVVKIDERAYGWVRIAPPENLRLYAAKMYVKFDAAAVDALAAAAAPKAAEVTPAEAKPAEVKPAEIKPAETPKTAEAPKPAEVKPAEIKPAETPKAAEEKPVAVKPAAPKKLDPETAKLHEALRELGIDATKPGKPIQLNGTLTAVPGSTNAGTNYALLSNSGDNIAFIAGTPAMKLESLAQKRVLLSGQSYDVTGWTVPVILLDKISFYR